MLLPTLSVRQILEKLLNHKRNLLAVILGQGATALGVLFGVRLLTEFISPAVFGEYKLLLAAISLLTGILIRPYIQFSMRAYHDAEKNDLVALFLKRVRGSFSKYTILIAVLFTTITSLFLDELITVSPYLYLLLPAVLVLQSCVELERGLMVTRNRQVHASAVSFSRAWLTPIVIVIVISLTVQTVDVLFVGTFLVSTLTDFFLRGKRVRTWRPSKEATILEL